MDKHTTWAACGGIAAGIAASGLAADRALRTNPALTIVAAALAGSYLIGTFGPRSRLFGRPTNTSRTDSLFALTFDDGPDPRHTPRISRTLAERGHSATFFVLGRAVREHPAIAAQLLADRHEIASHGDDHRMLAFASPADLRRQIAATERAIEMATGALPQPFFRPPHGVRSPWLTHVVGRAGYRVCAWDGTVFDTELGADTIAARVERLLRPGAIVLLHDGDGSGCGASRRQTVDALPAILDAADRRGLRSVPLSALVP